MATESSGPTPSSDLILAATAIFDGSSNEITLKSGKVVAVRPARMNQLGQVIKFFEALIMGIDSEMLGGLIELIADMQRAAIAKGEDPNKVKVDELSGVQLVHKTFGKVPIISQLFVAVFDHLPGMVAALSSLTADEFGELEADEGMMLATAIVTVNYSFFSQSLPPLLTAFMRSRASTTPLAPGKTPVRRRQR